MVVQSYLNVPRQYNDTEIGLSVSLVLSLGECLKAEEISDMRLRYNDTKRRYINYRTVPTAKSGRGS